MFQLSSLPFTIGVVVHFRDFSFLIKKKTKAKLNEKEFKFKNL